MSRQEQSNRTEARPELPIERGFPIERVNDIAEKEGWAKMYYRPIYTMHKWWARRMGSVFRSICLYTLIDNPNDIDVLDPTENPGINRYTGDDSDIAEFVDDIDMASPERLWDLFNKDVTVDGKKVLDPFMGGGTGVVEASRFGADVDGIDLNPVAWFVSKKAVEAGETELEEAESAFNRVKSDVADEIKSYYETPCPNGDHRSDVLYFFWNKEIECASCENPVALFNDYRIGKGRYGTDGYEVLCPDCRSIIQTDDWRSETECDCGNEFVPAEGTVSGSDYTCRSCDQRYPITDAVQDQGGFDLDIYAVEYHCPKCDDEGLDDGEVKGYKPAEKADHELYREASEEWQRNDELAAYVPDYEIQRGAITASSSISGNDVFDHGYEKWTDMYSDRQLLCFSKLLQSIDQISDQHLKEYLLLAFSGALRYNSMMIGYHASNNQIHDFFKSNSFVPPVVPTENNIWGGEYGTGTFKSMWRMVTRGIEWANRPTERYIEDGETRETEPFETPVGENVNVYCSDVRDLDAENEYDAVITDPPYYDNIIYSEVSDYFYVWQRAILKDEYEHFDPDHTSRKESIVANPAEGKGEEEFGSELKAAFSSINTALKRDGVLTFTYHHSDSESWGVLLRALCEVGFEVTATYPISADIQKFNKNEAVAFDIVIVARPFDDPRPISWNSLRRQIHRTATKTRETLEENRGLSSGDIGVIEMGECFREYSKHHGKVRRAGDVLSAKEVVDEIYGIIRDGKRDEQDVYLDLLEEHSPSYSDLNEYLKRSDASEEQLEDMRLVSAGGDFELYDWSDEKRQAYVQTTVEEGNGDLTDLDRAHFLRYRYEHDKSTSEYLERWDTDGLRVLCEGIAEATGDEIYLKMLDVDESLTDFVHEGSGLSDFA